MRFEMMVNFTPSQRNALIVLSCCLAALLPTAGYLRVLRSVRPPHTLFVRPTPTQLPPAEAREPRPSASIQRPVVLPPAFRVRTPASASSGVRLDINTASSSELQSLPGIGPSLAARIISHRRVDGPFQTPEDLLKVRGIGPATLAKIRPLVICSTQ